MKALLILFTLLLYGCQEYPQPLTRAQVEAIKKNCSAQERTIEYSINLRGQVIKAECNMTVQEFDQQPATVKDIE